MNFRKKSRSRRTSTNFMVDYMNGKWRSSYNKTGRGSSEVDDNSDEDDSRQEVTNWAEEFFGKRNPSSVDFTTCDQDLEVHLTKKQTIILATLVPDEILLMEKYTVGEPSRFVGVLLMADVSGYTALSERYSNTGKGGTYRLTATLNSYLGALIELIYRHGGDIIKFAGDAFLALWKTDKRTFLCHTIHTVIVCALVIQHSYARYETDVKVNLKVKLAISAGNLMFSLIGKNTDMNFVIFGLPVLEAKLAESLCSSGEVKLTPSAWAHCYSRNYDHVVHEDGHVTINAILYDPHETDVTKPYLGFTNLIRLAKKTCCPSDNLLDHWNANNETPLDIAKKNEIIGLRKAILVADEKDKGVHIRNFMIRPVLTQIDAHQPLEYLTEMRQVSVLFVTLKPRDCPPSQLITIVNNSYQITCEIVYKSMGCVNKIILFDKDVMILVIFGLRGFKHESEAQAALKCASGIKRSVSALDGVQEVSIGVTTGQVYCGVVGHPLRREFTVIGAVVNKAARLMCSFRNKITCDETTFVKSKMSKNGFTLQPHTELKGIGHPGKIYEYTEEIRVKELYNIPMIPPLLNRLDEIEYFDNWLDVSNLSYRDFDALLLIGESRIGKSRLLEWLSRISNSRGFNVCHLNLTSIHSANPYLALSQIIDQILGINHPKETFEKEQKIVELLKVYNEDLCYLNKIIKVRFAYHDAAYSLDAEKRKEKARNMFRQVLNSITGLHIVFLDDLQNLDASSWEYISLMLCSHNIFTVLTVTRGKFSSVHRWLYDVFIDDSIRKIVLGPLEPEWIAPLACQILDVEAVPNDLCNALRKQCKGIPGLVESFIVHLFSNGAIELKTINDSDLKEHIEEDLQFPDPLLLKPQALDIRAQETLDHLVAENATGEISICIVTAKEKLDTNINEHNVDVFIMIQIDVLTPYQQLLLKIASVIGTVFSRDLLENIMYENNPITTARAIKRLFAMRILTCANSKLRWARKKGQSVISTYSNTVLECDCNFEYDADNEHNLPKYAFCKEMKFRNKSSQKTCYELLPLNQKREFHTRIFNYLNTNQEKCPSCGGTVRILQSVSFQLDPEFEVFSEEDLARTRNKEHDTGSLLSVKNVHSDSYINRNNSTGLIKATSNLYLHGQNSLDSGRSTSLPKSEEDDPKRRLTKRVTISSMIWLQQNRLSCDDESIFSMLRSVLESETIADWHALGVVDSKDDIENAAITNKNEHYNCFSVKVEKGVSETDFNKCTCSDLTILVYEQLIHHAFNAELKLKAIECSLRYSYLNLLAENIVTAQEKLDSIESICHEDHSIPSPELHRFLGRIYSLQAACSLLTGQLTAAKDYLEKAAELYGIQLNNKSRLLSIKRLFMMKNSNPNLKKIMKIDSVFCLNIGTTLFTAMGDLKTSKKCAYAAIKIIQKIDCRVVDVCDAFTNAILLELDRGNAENCFEIEKIVKHIFHYLPKPVKAEELFALGKLFMALFRAKTASGNLPSAIRSGFRALVVSHFFHAYYVTIDIIPDMFYLLLCRQRIAEAIDVVKLSLRLTNAQNLYLCETWYYALCMDLILDTGLQLESPDEINRYAEFSLTRKLGGTARRRLVVNLWTFWLRMDVDTRARVFEDEALTWMTREDDDVTLTTLFSSLRLTEALLEYLARKMDDLRKVVDLMELRSLADSELSDVEKDCRNMRVIYCRWIRLRASSLALSGRHSAATAMYNQAIEESKRVYNFLEEELTRASVDNNKHWLQNARNGNFASWQQASQTVRKLAKPFEKI